MPHINDSRHIVLLNEIQDIIRQHTEELFQFGIMTSESTQDELELLLEKLDYLSTLPQYEPETASYEIYRHARLALRYIENFLSIMNQNLVTFTHTTSNIGDILQYAWSWCDLTAARFAIPMDEVWDLIDPAQPDHLDDLGRGVFEARWWKPVPMMDIEILYRTEAIHVLGVPFEPDNLSGGRALRFLVINVD